VKHPFSTISHIPEATDLQIAPFFLACTRKTIPHFSVSSEYFYLPFYKRGRSNLHKVSEGTQSFYYLSLACSHHLYQPPRLLHKHPLILYCFRTFYLGRGQVLQLSESSWTPSRLSSIFVTACHTVVTRIATQITMTSVMCLQFLFSRGKRFLPWFNMKHHP
jgi:hypothetical protein